MCGVPQVLPAAVHVQGERLRPRSACRVVGVQDALDTGPQFTGPPSRTVHLSPSGVTVAAEPVTTSTKWTTSPTVVV